MNVTIIRVIQSQIALIYLETTRVAPARLVIMVLDTQDVLVSIILIIITYYEILYTRF